MHREDVFIQESFLPRYRMMALAREKGVKGYSHEGKKYRQKILRD